MAQYLWQTSLTSQTWEGIMSKDLSVIYGELGATAESFGGSVTQSWVAFGENDFIAVVDMPDNESMAAFVLSMTVRGYYSQGKTTVLLSPDETDRALNRAGGLG